MKTSIRGLLIVVLALLTGAFASPVWAQAQNEIQKLLASDGTFFDDFGVAVAVDGDTAVIGAWLHDTVGLDSGAAYVFTRGGDGLWTEQQKLVASDNAINDGFGLAVAVHGDTAVIGANGHDDNAFDSGAAYVFIRNAGVWTQQQELNASDAAVNDRFGSSLALDGDTAIIGAELDDDNGSSSGSAYVFTRSGTVWTEAQKLTASDAANNDMFGNSLAIDGNTAVIGARFGNVGPLFSESDFGSVYVFIANAGVWTEQQKLIASDGAFEDQFGISVAVDGDTALIGAHRDDDDGDRSGAVYVFARTSGVWSELQKLTASDAAAQDEFGISLAVSGDAAVIGAWLDDDDGNESGSTYLFTRTALVWSEQKKLISSDAFAFDHFGEAVAMAGDTVVISAPRDDDNNSGSGSGYVFSLAEDDSDGDGDPDATDPDDDNDGIADELDTEPLNANNSCSGGDPLNVTFQQAVSGDITCAAEVSISVVPLTTVMASGDLRLIAPTVTMQSGFTVAGGLTVISSHPCPACSP